LQKKCPTTGLYFLSFAPALELVEVVVGHRCELTRADLDAALGKRAKSIVKFKARPAFKTFEVIENDKKAAWR